MMEILESLDERLDPAHTAILVVDMQNDFCAEGGYIHQTRGADMSAYPALAGRVSALADAGRDAGALVVWIQANYEHRYLSPQAILKRRERKTEAVCCAGGSWGWDFFRVGPAPEDIVIEKHTYNAFSGTNLDELLRRHGIKTLVFAGVATNTCVESSLRDGYFLGYYVVLAEDCCSSSKPHLHDATAENVRMNFGEVCSLTDLERCWTTAQAAAGG